MVMIFGTLVLNDDISRWFFSVSQNFDFLSCQWVKMAKKGPKSKQNLSVTHHISGAIHCMIAIYCTYVQMIMSSAFFDFFKIMIFLAIRGLKGQKWYKMTKILSVALHISGAIHHMIFIYGTYV